MNDLITADNLGAEADVFYAALIRAHEGLSPEQSRRLDARLVLLLANHIGDAEALARALTLAREGLASD